MLINHIFFRYSTLTFGLCLYLCFHLRFFVSYVIPSHIKMLIDENFLYAHTCTPYCRRMDFRALGNHGHFRCTISINFLHGQETCIGRDRTTERKCGVKLKKSEFCCVPFDSLSSFLVWYFDISMYFLPFVCMLHRLFILSRFLFCRQK